MVTQNYQCVQNHETWFTSRTHSSNCDGDVTILEHVLQTSIFAVSNDTSFVSVEGKVQEIQSLKFTNVHQNHKNGLYHGLIAPHLMGMSEYFYISLKTSIFAASNGSSLMSIGGRVRRYDWTKLPMCTKTTKHS